MESPSRTGSKKRPRSARRPFSGEHYYTSSVKLFHLNDGGPDILTGRAFLPMPADAPIRGFVCKAARLLLGRSQEWLSTASEVSRKTLNDFEIGEIEPKIALNIRIRDALEGDGASFVSGDSVVGVVVFSKPDSPQTSPRANHLAR